MEWFYAPGLSSGDLTLPEQEARHCVAVLRHKTGDVIQVVDCRGGYYQAQLVQADKRGVLLQIVEQEQRKPSPAVQLHMAISPTKNTARFEWFLEKATELGISTITPLITHRSERRKASTDRWERVLVAAMKQSGRSWLPDLRPSAALSDVLRDAWEAQRFIAHCSSGERQSLWTAAIPDQDVLMLIGPEGDFDEAEIIQAQEAGFKAVHLGEARLRTETAGIAAVHVLNLIQNSDFARSPEA